MWFRNLLIFLFVLECIMKINVIGKQHTYTVGEAVGQLVFNALLIWGVVVYLGPCQ